MIRGLYTAAAGMIAEQRKHDTITNNIANLNTPGFKQGNTQFRSFPEMMLYLINGGAGEPPKPIGRIQNGVFAEENVIGFSQGDMQETKNPTDFAIVSNIQVQDNQQNNIPFDEKGQFVTPQGTVIYQPQAFFTVASEANPQEIKYTRNGSFQVNQAGYLVTSSGYRVLGVNGQPIVMDRQIGDIKVLPDGSFADPSNGQLIQDANGNDVKLFLSQIDNPNQLIPQGNGVYVLNPAQSKNPPAPVDPAYISVKQGFIERSNVDPTQSTVDLMTAMRAYEANQKVIQYYDRSLEKAVNEIGRV